MALRQAENGIDFKGKYASAATATTLLDGEVVISIEPLRDAADDKNPDWLAATLFDESVHFTELVTKGQDSGKFSALSKTPINGISEQRIIDIKEAGYRWTSWR